MGSPRLALVGAFVIGGLLIFAVGLFMIGDRRLLFSEQFEVEADFGNVAGVEIGTSVRLSGLPAGEVIGIDIPGAPGGRFVVRMRVREDLHALVRTDSEAAILSDGLLGSAFIQLRAGSEDVDPIRDGGKLRGIDAVAIADLIAEGRETFRVASDQIVILRGQMSQTLTSVSEAMATTTRLIDQVGSNVRESSAASMRLVEETHGMVADARAVMASVSAGEGAVYENIERIADETSTTMEATRKAVAQAVDRFSGPESAAQTLLADAGEVMRHARRVMADVADNTEALKRNWLFRGFFAERGFYNLDELTVAEYRRLSRDDDRYVTLRVWLKADLLFDEADPGELKDDAGQRIEEAMGKLLQYPRASPIVVEGYATEGEIDRQLLAAYTRAERVERYLVRTFRRAGATGMMALGAEAAESPSGDGRWDGVALTLFADPEQLARAAVATAQ